MTTCRSASKLYIAGSTPQFATEAQSTSIFDEVALAVGRRNSTGKGSATSLDASALLIGLRKSQPVSVSVTGKENMMSGSTGKAALATCVERKSRYLLASKTEDKTAASFNAAIVAGMLTIPEELRRTVTVDNGSEMANFKELEVATGLTTYFCDARSPWQRGTNENCNGLLRQYFGG